MYEGLGYAEVVQVTLKAKEKPEYFNVLNERNEFEALLKSYFGSFHSGSRAAGGVGYQFRNCIGLPHGMLSPLYSAVQAANTQGMALVKGKGDDPDAFNTVCERNKSEKSGMCVFARKMCCCDCKREVRSKSNSYFYSGCTYRHNCNGRYISTTPTISNFIVRSRTCNSKIALFP